MSAMLPSSPTSCLPAPVKTSVIMCSSESSSLSSASHDSSCLAGTHGNGNGGSVWPIIHKLSEAALRNQNRRIGSHFGNFLHGSQSNKPIMEKRRRARINNCLNELKAILLDAMRKDPARHSKLEKADILELTVSHLKSLHRHSQHGGFHMSSLDVSLKFREGFSECIAEVGRFLSTLTCDAASSAVTRSLLSHLADCIGDCNLSVAAANNQQQHMHANATVNGNTHALDEDGLVTVLPELNNNEVNVISKQPPPLPSQQQQQPLLSLVPTWLPSGEFLFLFPGQSPPSVVTPSQAQAHDLQMQQHSHHQPLPLPLLSPEVPLELTVSPTQFSAAGVTHQPKHSLSHSVLATGPAYPIAAAMAMNGGHDRDRDRAASFRKSHVYQSDSHQRRHSHGHGHGHQRQMLAVIRHAAQHQQQKQALSLASSTSTSHPHIQHLRPKPRHSSDRSHAHAGTDSRPLSLVTPKKDEATDMSCWRPW